MRVDIYRSSVQELICQDNMKDLLYTEFNFCTKAIVRWPQLGGGWMLTDKMTGNRTL